MDWESNEAAGAFTLVFALVLGAFFAAMSFGAATFAVFARTLGSVLRAMCTHHFCCVALHNKCECKLCQQKMVQCTKISLSSLIRQSQTFKALIMVIRRAELVFNHRRPLKEMANGQLLRDANAAMRLNGALPNKFC